MGNTFLLTLSLGAAILIGTQAKAGYAPVCSGCVGGYGYFSSNSPTRPTFFSTDPLSECNYDLSQSNCIKGTNPGPEMCVCIPLYYTKSFSNWYTSCSDCQAASTAKKSPPKNHGRK